MNAPIDVTGIRIETERLILRPWEETDLEDLFEYASVPGVGELAGWKPHQSREQSLEILNMFIRNKKTFALVFKENSKVVGALGLEPMDPDPLHDGRIGREIGYVLSKDYWGRGLMPEAVNAVIRYCFHVLGYDYLTCGYFTGNSQSQRVIEKCGFRFFAESEFETRFNTVEIARNYVLYNPDKGGNICLN